MRQNWMGRTTLKLLENIALVQFFLYEAKDLETGINTAFLGPNGTGKSALLDAIQVVMLAADGNRTHFNAATSDANLAVLKHTYSTERLGETLDSAEAEIEKLTEEIERAKLELVRSEAESTLAIEARDRVIAELNRDPDFRKQAGCALRCGYRRYSRL